MGHNKKLHLAGIQEFRAAAYVKDLTVCKFDAQATKGCFVGYDLESKGYQIYWPGKCSITVEQNVIFNQDNTNTHDDTAIIYGKVLSEGRRKKSSKTLKIMPRTSKTLKIRNLKINKLKKSNQNLTKVPSQQTLLLFQHPKSHKMTLIQSHRTTASCQTNSMVADNELDMREDIIKL